MKASLALASLISLAACSSSDTTLKGAADATPIRYVLCTNGESYCFVSARFKDMDGCERHKAWSEMLCDSRSRPGVMICQQDNKVPIATAHCTI